MRSCKNCEYRKKEMVTSGAWKEFTFFCDNPNSPYYQEETDKDDECERWLKKE